MESDLQGLPFQGLSPANGSITSAGRGGRNGSEPISSSHFYPLRCASYQANITYDDLANRLKAHGFNENAASIAIISGFNPRSKNAIVRSHRRAANLARQSADDFARVQPNADLPRRGENVMILRSFGVAAALGLAITTSAVAQSESVLMHFCCSNYPNAQLLQDSSGDLVGTTEENENNGGTVFRLKQVDGVWRHQYLFTFAGLLGYNPQGVVEDANGVYYGATEQGGAEYYGSIYSLSKSHGKWVHTILYSFHGEDDSGYPDSRLFLEPATGNLFGLTRAGGSAGCGSVFEFNPSNGAVTTIYSFVGGSDGCITNGELHSGGQKGVLLGTTQNGGSYDSGTIFALRESGGTWNESVLYSFSGGSDGTWPQDIDVDSHGNIFGVAEEGGTGDRGTVFELPYQSHSVTTLYAFQGDSDGYLPCGLHLERSTGELFGTTQYGGSEGYGTAFQLTNNSGIWSESILHSFGVGSDGRVPQVRPIEDSKSGALYGTTTQGGRQDGGTVWMIARSPMRR